ncbi:putative Flp pilus-assembly TadE/G-like protein [Knoellia remsis]|uniref:Putative Flp pilus-assembly TadE/G-like protein n=1 Tax=Knoellia remsis TaxID=407159 RepID=A0A2T0UYB2_9MICO|nr:pilus assembly protein TadG-related protein [Knoellia remsis]PRY62837.1 putative Flp pilus-assembly TadE/G-like protein [Knoellia remsis]
MTTRSQRDEEGRVIPLILVFTMICILLITGVIAVTSVHLSRMKLLDVSDGAALAAANALDEGTAYGGGVRGAVPLTDATVRQEASEYVSSRPLPGTLYGWSLGGRTGTPDGELAVVEMTGTAKVPFIGWMLGDGVRVTVVSRARADLEE